jgi:hypothetical protein
VTELDRSQKKAGRLFRDACQADLDALNAARPPAGDAMVFWLVYRHSCRERGGSSIGIQLRPRVTASPEYWVCYCSSVGLLDPEVFPHRDCDGGSPAAPGGLFTFTWKEGECRFCRLMVRSTAGRLQVADLASRE